MSPEEIFAPLEQCAELQCYSAWERDIHWHTWQYYHSAAIGTTPGLVASSLLEISHRDTRDIPETARARVVAAIEEVHAAVLNYGVIPSSDDRGVSEPQR